MAMCPVSRACDCVLRKVGVRSPSWRLVIQQRCSGPAAQFCPGLFLTDPLHLEKLPAGCVLLSAPLCHHPLLVMGLPPTSLFLDPQNLPAERPESPQSSTSFYPHPYPKTSLQHTPLLRSTPGKQTVKHVTSPHQV